jgi:dUTP pyrophosphatase
MNLKESYTYIHKMNIKKEMEPIIHVLSNSWKAYIGGLVVYLRLSKSHSFNKDSYDIPVENEKMVIILKKIHEIMDKLTLKPWEVFSSFLLSNEVSSLLKWDFVRGCFECCGTISIEESSGPVCKFPYCIKELQNFASLPCENGGRMLVWNGISALDFLGYMYKSCLTSSCSIYKRKKYRQFTKSVLWSPDDKKLPTFYFSKTSPEAVAPHKSRLSDSGYDLHVIKKVKESKGVSYYDTGIQVQPQYGYYFDLVGRSSIAKKGWMVANNVGIIDQSYRGSILVALVPSVPNPTPLELPCKLVQLIPRKVIVMNGPRELKSLTVTDRSDSGGLGSKNFDCKKSR